MTIEVAAPELLAPSMPGSEAKLQILLKEIHTRWRRLSDADLSAIKSRDELIARVLTKYSRRGNAVHADVDNFLGGRVI